MGAPILNMNFVHHFMDQSLKMLQQSWCIINKISAASADAMELVGAERYLHMYIWDGTTSRQKLKPTFFLSLFVFFFFSGLTSSLSRLYRFIFWTAKRMSSNCVSVFLSLSSSSMDVQNITHRNAIWLLTSFAGKTIAQKTKNKQKLVMLLLMLMLLMMMMLLMLMVMVELMC